MRMGLAQISAVAQYVLKLQAPLKHCECRLFKIGGTQRGIFLDNLTGSKRNKEKGGEKRK